MARVSKPKDQALPVDLNSPMSQEISAVVPAGTQNEIQEKAFQAAAELGAPEGEPIDQSEIFEEQPNTPKPISMAALSREFAAQERKAARLEKQLDKIRVQNQERERLLVRAADSREQATVWLSQVQDSFIWKLSGRLFQEREQAKALIAQMESDVNSVALPEQGELPRLQLQFNRNFLLSFIAPFLVMFVAVVVPWAFTIQPIEELAFMYDPQTAAPFIVGVVLTLLAISALLVYLANRDKFPILTFSLWVVGIAALGFLIYQLNFLEPWLRSTVAPWLANSFIGLLLISIFILLLGVFAALLVYYSGWSQFRRRVQLEVNKLENVVKGYVATQQELRRLESVHQQADSWLNLLASAIHRPWKVDPKWLEEPTSGYEMKNTPAALRIARAIDSGDSKTSSLERTVGEKLLVRGWRNDAFEDMVKGVGQSIGLAPENFNTDTLDGDLPHLPNNHRAIVQSFLNQTAKNETREALDFSAPKMDTDAPGGVKPTDKYLREIALRRIRALLRDAQMNAIRVERPDVQPIGRKDHLVFQFDETGFDEVSTKRSWDEFLSDSLGTVDEAQPPLSPMVFTTQGKSQRLHEKVVSFLLAPARIKATIPNVRAKSVTLVASGDSKPRRVEIIARIDVSEGVSPDSLTLFAGQDQSELLGEQLKAETVKVCQECGLLYCKASKNPGADCSEVGKL